MQIVITCLFGLEHYCVEDLENIGYSKAEMTVTDGQVLVETTPLTMADDCARICVWMRRGERVLLSVNTFPAETFEEFFDGFSSMRWNQWIPRNWAFHLNGYSRDSKLFGIPACQSLAKKAIVKALLSERKLPDGSMIEEDEKLVAFRVEAIVENEDHKAVKGFSQGLFEVRMVKMRLDRMLKEASEAAFEDKPVEAMAFTGDVNDEI